MQNWNFTAYMGMQPVLLLKHACTSIRCTIHSSVMVILSFLLWQDVHQSSCDGSTSHEVLRIGAPGRKQWAHPGDAVSSLPLHHSLIASYDCPFSHDHVL